MHDETFTLNREYIKLDRRVVEPRYVNLKVPSEIDVPLMIRRVAPGIYDRFKQGLMEFFGDRTFYRESSPDSEQLKEFDMQVYRVHDDLLEGTDLPKKDHLDVQVQPEYPIHIEDIVVGNKSAFVANRISHYLDDYDMTVFACMNAYWLLFK